MENWDEVRTAFQVARMGTVSGAAEVLGVHHATVIRHVDALETHLGVKLFQRHARGYTATEAGQDLLRVAQATDDQFAQLQSRIKGAGDAVSGELVVTSIGGLAALMVPAMDSFRQNHPEVILRYLTGERIFRLEYGEAHVAVRAGNAPQEPDNVVQPFFRQRTGLYCSRAYAERYGMPDSPADYPQHWFIGSDEGDTRAPFYNWLWNTVPPERIIMRATDLRSTHLALLQGMGIGFLPLWMAKDHPDLLEVCPPDPEWEAELWLVTHVDLHRTSKVQAFLGHLKGVAASWTQV